ncbi:MAG: hypothetical protein Rhirs2KO_11380 [Rhizobiaceae bacterium]
MDDRQLLAEVEDIIRTAPPQPNWGDSDPEIVEWLGRVEATFMDMEIALSSAMIAAIRTVNSFTMRDRNMAELQISRLLQTARWRLRQKTGGPTAIAVDSGMVFDYFAGVSKVLQTARQDVLFVDPYLDGEVVERYLPSVTAGANIRMLGRERIPSLVAAAGPFARQHGLAVEVRSAPGFHDRYLFIDRQQCLQSGASFKDGARRSPTTLTEITDAFSAVWDTYDRIWQSAHTNALP